MIIRESLRFIERDDKGMRRSPALSRHRPVKLLARVVSATERKLRNYEKRPSLNESALGETFVVRNNNGVSRAPDYFEITRYMTLIERLPVGVALMENRFSDPCRS